MATPLCLRRLDSRPSESLGLPSTQERRPTRLAVVLPLDGSPDNASVLCRHTCAFVPLPAASLSSLSPSVSLLVPLALSFSVCLVSLSLQMRCRINDRNERRRDAERGVTHQPCPAPLSRKQPTCEGLDLNRCFMACRSHQGWAVSSLPCAHCSACNHPTMHRTGSLLLACLIPELLTPHLHDTHRLTASPLGL